MNVSVKQDDKTAVVSLEGNFDFNARAKFQNAFREVAKGKSFVLDFAGVGMIDSSGIGMLLVLREHAGLTQADITIINCNAIVKKALAVVRLDVLFKVQ